MDEPGTPESAAPASDGYDDVRPAGGLTVWLQLMRLPAVFTALSNVLCGYFVTRVPQAADAATVRELGGLLLSTFGLYMGGMVLNDVFDAALDQQERPERPIPSGRISRRAAAVFGTGLMGLGLAAAAVTGRESLLIAVAIIAVVLLYNGSLKSTALAPAGMGTCRFLNLLLGASTGLVRDDRWYPLPFLVAAGLGLYVAGVTLFARDEAGHSHPRRHVLATGMLLAGLAVDLWAFGGYGITDESVAGARMALLLLGLNLLLRASAAIMNPTPPRVMRTVGLMLLCIIFLDAVVVFGLTASGRLAAIVILMVMPASLLRRVVPMS